MEEEEGEGRRGTGEGDTFPPAVFFFFSIFDSESIIFNLSAGICVTKADANCNKRRG